MPEDISDDESRQTQLKSKKIHMADWVPPSHLGSEDAWLEEQNKLAATSFMCEHEETQPKCQARAEELLRMIEAIGCNEVMMAWNEAVT